MLVVVALKICRLVFQFLLDFLFSQFEHHMHTALLLMPLELVTSIRLLGRITK